jgi:glycine cleavage system H protein
VSVPEDLRFTRTHEWVRIADGTATIGISDHAQSELGDITYLELPDPGDQLSAGEPLGVIESVKAASDIYSPVSGAVIERNDAVVDTPELVNSSPYDQAWLLVVKVDDDEQLANLMDSTAYETFLADEA